MTVAPSPSPVVAPASPSKAGPDGLRPDIQALRAIAVGSVVAFHLWPDALPGGYVGVDVFFAISGFLITSHLLAEVERTGGLRPGRFWARRAKRLVPASTIVLLFTTLAVWQWAPAHNRHQFLDEIIAAAVQVENWLLAGNAVNYLAAANVASPTQHFWSLGVEEQFYVALPLLILAAVGISRLLHIGYRRLILATFVVIVVASLAYSVWLTNTTPGVAYFSTLTRAWEFGFGVLLAYVGSSRQLHRVLPWLGVAAIAVACIWFNAHTSFPGWAAALPVGGAVLVMWSGVGSGFDRFGAVAPIAFVGRISYAIYLWHWPLIVVLAFITGRRLNEVDKVGIVVVTLVLAWLSTTFLEDPIRFRPRLLGRRRPLVVGAWAAAAIAVVVAVAATASQMQTNRDRELAQAAQRLTDQQPPCFGAQSMDPARSPCHNFDLDGVLVPDPARAEADDPGLSACWGLDGDAPRVCQLGPSTGYTKHLLAIGDSHASMLIGVLGQIAERNRWRIDVAVLGGCYLTTGQQSQPKGDIIPVGCDTWRTGVTRIANDGGFDAIVVTHADSYHPVVAGPGETQAQATVRGLVGAWRRLPDVPIIAIRDNPSMRVDVLTCVEAHRDTAATACALPRSQALSAPDGQAQAAKQVPRARVIDMTSFYCTAKVCPPVIGHVLAYRDGTHLTNTYALSLAPYLNQKMVAALAN